MSCFLLLAFALLPLARAQINENKPPSRLMIDPPKSIQKVHPVPVVPADVVPQFIKLGVYCRDNFTCSSIPNSHCSNESCRCLPSFYEDPRLPGNCRLAPGYSEPCAAELDSVLGPSPQCREPYTCNATGYCDCPQGFIQEYFQCIRDCPNGHVAVGNECLEVCKLGEKCSTTEQCIQSYAQCLHRQCQCIPGANQFNGNCYPVNQCPLGEPAKNDQGQIRECKSETSDSCPKDHYCLFAQFTDAKGFCCPKIKMNCPIGKPLDGRNCSDCPWETHHCFSYVIGTYTETMCCPNACPTTQPIQKDGMCFSRSAFGGHCAINDQCYNVAGAQCRLDTSGRKRCLCPKGNWRNYFGRCLRESALGQNCTRNEECKVGTNTICEKGMCSCYNGYMPEPAAVGSTSQTCIAEPSCPTATGVHTMQDTYRECSDDPDACEALEFCRKWWFDGNRTYSLCCPKPGLSDYQNICRPFRMRLILANQLVRPKDNRLSSPQDAEPLRCDIAPIPHQLVFHDVVDGNVTIPLRLCPVGSSCLFDPFSAGTGVCCRPMFEDQAKGAKADNLEKADAPEIPAALAV